MTDRIKKLMYLLPVTVILLNVWFLVTHAWLVDSDMSAELLLADHLNSTGGIVSQNWYYTTEVRVFHLQWIFRLFLLLFPGSWHTARVLSMLVLYVLYGAAAVLLCGRVKAGEYAALCAGLLLLPLGGMYWFLGIWGGWYLVYALYAMTAFSLVLSEGKQRIPALAAGMVLAFLTGMNGVKQMLVFYAPLLLALSVRAVYRKKAGYMQIHAAAAALMNIAGMLANRLLFDDFLYTRYSDLKWLGSLWSSRMDLSRLLNVWGDFLALFGLQGDVKVLSLYGAASLCGLMAAFMILYALVRESKKDDPLYLFVLSALLTDGMCFAFTDAHYNASLWLVLVPFALVLCIRALAQTEWNRIWILLFSACLVFTSAVTVTRESQHPVRGKRWLKDAVTWLTENGYEYGEATYWSADAAVEMSSGRLKICARRSYDRADGISWGQPADAASQVSDMQFFLVDKSEEGLNGYEEITASRRVVYENGGYYVTVSD